MSSSYLISEGVMDGEYENMPRLTVEFGDQIGTAVFVRVCENCGRFVKANDVIRANDWTGLHPEPNAMCAKCGPTHMLLEGFM